MAVDDVDAFFSDLDALGEGEVRSRLARRLYGQDKAALVEEWLRRLEAERDERTKRIEAEHRAIDLRLKKGAHAAAWFANTVSVIAFLCSAASLAFSFVTYRDAHREPLLIRVTRSFADYSSVLEPSALPPASADLTTFWEVLVANNGQQAVSILSVDPQLMTPGGRVFYSGFEAGVFDDQLRPASPPWSLDPGKSLKLSIRLRLHVDPVAYAFLLKTFPEGRVPSIHQAEMLLAGQQLDFWGNEIEPIRFESRVTGFKVTSRKHEPTIAFVLKTARGTTESDIATWYPFAER